MAMNFTYRIPRINRYEIYPGYGALHKINSSVIEKVIEDIRAAAALDIPFTVRTEHSREFRFGGNAVKAHIYTYVVTLGEMTEFPDEPTN